MHNNLSSGFSASGRFFTSKHMHALPSARQGDYSSATFKLIVKSYSSTILHSCI